MQIREARPDDSDFIFHLGHSEFTRYGGHGGFKCLEGMKAPNAITLICEDGTTQQPLGFAIVTWWEGPYLFAVATAPQHRHTGIAKALVLECSIRAQSKFGDLHLVLHVGRSNLPALLLFRSLGFVETPEPRGYPMYWPGVDVAIRMIRAAPSSATAPQS